MSQFLLEVTYTPASWGTQIRQHANVLDRIAPLMEACGGTVTSAFYAFGEYDAILIMECPSHEQATAFCLAARAGGAVETARLTPLMTIDQGIAAMTLASEVAGTYKAPVGPTMVSPRT